MFRSILATLAAACILSAGVAAVFAPRSARAQTSLSGEWRGQSSGNVVMITDQGGSLYVQAVSNNANQGAPMVFNRVGAGEYRYTFPDGNQAVIRMEGANIRLTTPDGWTDLFIPANRPAPSAAAAPSRPVAPSAPPVDPAVTPTILQAMAQADAASRDALEAALTTPAPPVTPGSTGPASFASSSASTTAPTTAQSTGRGPSAAYQRDGSCLTMRARPDGGGWQIVSTCTYRAFGAWCYDDDGSFSCAKKMKGGFGPLPAATPDKPSTENVSTSPRDGATFRMVWCDYEDWVKGTCDGDFEPWTTARSGS